MANKKITALDEITIPDAGDMLAIVDNGNTSKVQAENLFKAILPFTAETLLKTTGGVNLNTSTPTTLYQVPVGFTCFITKVVIRNASTSLTLASYSFGSNSASYNDVIADATHTELTGNTLYTVLLPKIGAASPSLTNPFKIKVNTLQGAAATVTIDVFGYIF
jgi:hypothetical protein